MNCLDICAQLMNEDGRKKEGTNAGFSSNSANLLSGQSALAVHLWFQPRSLLSLPTIGGITNSFAMSNGKYATMCFLSMLLSSAQAARIAVLI